jgi:hypothetical protein
MYSLSSICMYTSIFVHIYKCMDGMYRRAGYVQGILLNLYVDMYMYVHIYFQIYMSMYMHLTDVFIHISICIHIYRKNKDG